MSWTLQFTRQALKDAELLKRAGLFRKAETLLSVVENNPFQNPPPYEKLVGDFKGLYSRRINIQHRMVYQVDQKETIVLILRLWSHYE